MKHRKVIWRRVRDLNSCYQDEILGSWARLDERDNMRSLYQPITIYKAYKTTSFLFKKHQILNVIFLIFKKKISRLLHSINHNGLIQQAQVF